ncbi:NAD-dependent epimerase/dehydratase family protein [Ornithinimicrobium cryptoxanthini]|uniref:NAD-dependent epimerase/dehydratase family protein n=1 Tax=Ornithinimicrobium cryptoxanthini TaxID=2934161 RepID=UPI002118D66C|nr:NAD-dependent epimerase/dehydratase family protein [Ornithinimicrobium cryptoxanthini]
MNITITGGAGFIGSNLCRRLQQESAIGRVTVIDDLSSGFAENLNGVDVDFIKGSILDLKDLERATRNADAIIHLAAVGSVPRSIDNPLATHEANNTGTLRVLEAARHRQVRIVMASSSSVYGANPAMPKSETLQCLPMSPYAVSKLAGENYAMAYSRCYDLKVLPFRFFNVFGPRQMPGHAYAAVVPVFLQAALTGKALPVNGDGEQSRDFTFVGTVAETLTQAVLREVSSSPTNLAFGTRTTLNELIRLIEDIVGHPLRVTHNPQRPGDVQHSQADNSALRALFPNISPVPLEDGLRQTAGWLKHHLSVSSR